MNGHAPIGRCSPLRARSPSRQSAAPAGSQLRAAASRRTGRRRTALLLLGGLLSGCAVGPNYHTPQPQVPEQWHSDATAGLAPGAADVQTWWQLFADDQLTRLIERAATGNLDLRLATLRVREARALRGLAAGALLPTLSGSGSYQRSKASGNGPLGAGVQPPSRGEQFTETVARGVAGSTLGQGLATAFPGATGVTTPLATGLIGLVPVRRPLADTDDTDLFATGFDASWELDVFGGVRRNVEAADADLAAMIEDYRDVLVSLLAEVAATYIDLRALQSEIDATRRNIELQQQTLALTQVRFAAQLTSELDVRQAQTNLATTESELPVLESAQTLAIYRLSVLLGCAPATLQAELAPSREIPDPPAQTLVGVPADILRRRPDLRAAERRLAAQTARIGVAAAELYPRFTLSGTFALQATDINHLADGRSLTFGLGPALRWNIFDGLRNLNRVAAQEAVTQQAYVAYERTLLLALQEVESALVAYKSEQAHRDALLRAVDAARQAVRLAETRYEDGLTDFQNVLTAQRSLVTLENSVARSHGQVAVNLVALYKALGGGWSIDQPLPAEAVGNPTGVLADPLHYFVSGGQTPLPWEAPPEPGAAPPAPPANKE